MKRFGTKLKAMRDTRGWAQSKTAERLGVAPQTISNLEQGKSEPSLETLIAITKVFGVTLDELVADTNETQERTEALAAISTLLGRLDTQTLIVARDQIKALIRIGGR